MRRSESGRKGGGKGERGGEVGDICRHAHRASCTCTESKTCSGSGA